MKLARKIRMGMVGGGPGAMIGPIHRLAAALDGQIELVCGVFSSSHKKSLETAKSIHLAPDRVYENFQQMMDEEAALPADQRMDFVSIVTPNHMHFPVAAAALAKGFHVLCDKPATLNLDEAIQLSERLNSSGLLYGLTHTYAGYPMVKQARALVAEGVLGNIRKVLVEYPQGWLAGSRIELSSKQAEWRLDSARTGLSSCVGDIGSHAAHICEYVINDSISEICADLGSVVSGRILDDDATVILRFTGGARGVLIASQICAGEENTLKLRVYGEKGGLEWSHSDPNSLHYKPANQPAQILRAGGPGLAHVAAANCRTPSGHPEGYLEAFANHYRNFAGQIDARLTGRNPSDVEADVPGIADALRGMRFIESAVKASTSDQKWYRLPPLVGIDN
ncbi:Gfo/Idh/MocA family protein [Spongiibacter sp.]|uniref:Gfo/Idh/MocA family protein n=1 Tax=Spongiibacter sp. TaxID=2024860 RepID=UPI0035676060